MEQTLTGTQALLYCAIALSLLGLIYSFMWIIMSWFPRTSKLRIKEKRKGQLIFYRAEVYRPIFGWTGFWSSKYSGSINIDKSWTSSKNECENNIIIFKLLKNID